MDREILQAAERGHHENVARLLDEAGDTVARSTLVSVLWYGCLSGRPLMLEAALSRGVPVDEADAEGTTALHRAATFGRNDCVRLLIGRGADVHRPRADGRTALIMAGQRGDAETMRLLVAAGADVDAEATDGDRAITTAADNGRWDCVESLVSLGAALDVDARYGTPLLASVARRAPSLVPSLLAAGADATAARGPGHRTALHHAAGAGHVEAIRALVASAADLEARDSSLHTPIFHATRASAEAVSVLIELGADVNVEGDDGMTVLTHAVEWKRTEVVAALLRAGAEIQPPGAGRWAPLNRAAGLGLTEVVQLLLDAGADPEYRSRPWGATALMHAVRGGHAETAAVLHAAGADAHARDEHGANAMAYAAHARVPHAVEFLAGLGVAAGPPDGLGVAPLTVAAREGHEPVVRSLLGAGADPNARGRDEAPLNAAVARANTAITRLLLEAGADPELGAPPPLVTATRHGWYDDRHRRPRSKADDATHQVIELLLEAGANPNARSEDPDQSALQWAEALRSPWVVALLKRYGAE